MLEIKGLIPAIVTPMKADESIDEEQLRTQVRRQIGAGASGVFALGTNGEGYILSEAEKQEVLEIVVNEADGKVPVYAGTGCTGTSQTIAQSKMAHRLGVDAVSLITPDFCNASQEELFRHYSAVASTVDLPIVLYNIPQRTGNHLKPETVRRLAGIENIKAIKDSSGVFDNILRYIETTRGMDFAVLSGNDGLIYWTLAAGGAGAVSGMANIIPGTMVGICRQFAAGNTDESRKLQESIRPLRDCLALDNPNTVVKYATERTGCRVGPCRKPFHLLPDDVKARIDKVLQEMGLLPAGDTNRTQ